MIFILLQVVFSSAFTLIIKWVQIRKTENILTVGAINYIVAALAIAPFFFANLAPDSVSISLTDSVMGISSSAMLTGAGMGVLYFIAFYFVIYAVREVGASSTMVVSVLSLLIPMIFAAWVWQEIPQRHQSAGIGLALASLLLIGWRGRTTPAAGARQWLSRGTVILLIFFLLCGLSRLSQEAFKHLSVPSQRPTFVFFAFLASAIPSIVSLLVRGRRISGGELAIGILMGIVNMLQTQLILNALEIFPGYIVFPCTSAGSIVLTTIVATLMMQERISRPACWGIGLAVLSLGLLHWPQ